MFSTDESGQAHVIESVAAGMLILTTVIFAIQATAVTPLTISTSNEHIETQQQRMADGVLSNAQYMESAEETNTLKDAILYWDTDENTFYNTSSEGYLGTYPNNDFGDLLAKTFSEQRIATNIYITYERPGRHSGTKQMVDMGKPSDNSVTATTNVVIYNDDTITAPGESKTVEETSNYFAEDVNTDSNVYNVMEIRIVVWRI